MSDLQDSINLENEVQDGEFDKNTAKKYTNKYKSRNERRKQLKKKMSIDISEINVNLIEHRLFYRVYHFKI